MLTEPIQSSHFKSPAKSPAERVWLLADDVTGACDASAAFLSAGHAVRVWFGSRALFPAAETAQAFHTASRGLGPEAAADAVSQAAAGLRLDSDTLLFKKVDSAGRGPIGAEVLALHRALGTRAVLLAPAFPAAGRTVRGGILEVRDECGLVAQVDLRAWFAPEIGPAMVTISAADEVAPALAGGKTVLVCNSAAQSDLEALARAAGSLQGLLYAGSAGLARAISSLHTVAAPAVPAPAAARTLVITGTLHRITALQLAALRQRAMGREDVQILRIECNHEDGPEVRAACTSFNPEALIVTGGDTVQFVAEALGAHSILLDGEFAPGIPWGRLQGGMAEGRIVVTKSGGFGSATALNDIVAALSGVA
ncbi:MAG TPA: four-carbon acid sugar kinase family protein [Terracidiphilus sp.]|jgi:uncharacterized protein YgbK (DUF1537 family)